MVADSLIVGKEKELPFNDRAADAATVFVVVVRALANLWVFEIIPGVEVYVAIVLVR